MTERDKHFRTGISQQLQEEVRKGTVLRELGDWAVSPKQDFGRLGRRLEAHLSVLL